MKEAKLPADQMQDCRRVNVASLGMFLAGSLSCLGFGVTHLGPEAVVGLLTGVAGVGGGIVSGLASLRLQAGIEAEREAAGLDEGLESV